MKKLSKKQLKEIAIRHCAGVLLGTESLIAFEGTGITNEEARYILYDKQKRTSKTHLSRH